MKVAQYIIETKYFIEYNNVSDGGQLSTKWSYSKGPEVSPGGRISSWWSFDLFKDKWSHFAVDSVSADRNPVGFPAQIAYTKEKGFTFTIRGHELFYGVISRFIDTADGPFITNLRTYWMAFDPDLSTLSPSPTYLGTAAPSPPSPLLTTPRKKMNCCDCNTIATIIENQSLAQLRAQEKLVESLKDHIDLRTLEIIKKDLEHLKALDFEEFLKVILKRINESESNLWNGAPR